MVGEEGCFLVVFVVEAGTLLDEERQLFEGERAGEVERVESASNCQQSLEQLHELRLHF